MYEVALHALIRQLVLYYGSGILRMMFLIVENGYQDLDDSPAALSHISSQKLLEVV